MKTYQMVVSRAAEFRYDVRADSVEDAKRAAAALAECEMDEVCYEQGDALEYETQEPVDVTGQGHPMGSAVFDAGEVLDRNRQGLLRPVMADAYGWGDERRVA